MTATSLQFGPEWMRNKQQATTRPPASLISPTLPSTSPPAPGASSYSSLLTPVPQAPQEKQDFVNPFKYSKEELLQVWKDGGGRGGLGLEVELWEGVVREIGGEPIGLKEMSEGERKIFSLPLNSDLRRRQSHDFLPNLSLATDRPKLSHSAATLHSPLSQQRLGALLSRKRKDDGTDCPPLSLPRRLSLSSVPSSLGAPLSPTGGALPSPRGRLGGGSHGLDGTTMTGDGSWRKREVDPGRAGSILGDGHTVKERDEEAATDPDTSSVDPNSSLNGSDISHSNSVRSMAPSPPSFRDDPAERYGPTEESTVTEELTATLSGLTILDERKKPDLHNVGAHHSPNSQSGISAARPPGLEEDPSNVSWSYRDPKGNIQGPFTATLMQKWYEEGYFAPDLLMKRTHLDVDWTPVGELSRRAGNEKLFFSSFSEHAPPGLSPRPSGDSLAHDRFGQPLGLNVVIQPMHQLTDPFVNGHPLSHFRHPTTRTSTLDSYLGSPSNSSHPPASSFVTNIAPISSASPDLLFSSVGGRTHFGHNGTEPAYGGGLSGFESQTSSFATRSENVSAGAAGDSSYGTRLASLGQRGSVYETQGFNNLTNPIASASPWGTGIPGSIPRNDSEDFNIANYRSSLNNGSFGGSPATGVPDFSELSNNDSTMYGLEAYNSLNDTFPQPTQGDSSVEPASLGFGPIGMGGSIRDQGSKQQQDMASAPVNIPHGMDEYSQAASSFGNGFGPIMTPGVHGQGSVFVMPGQAPSQQVSSQHLSSISTYSQSPAAPAPSSPASAIQPQHAATNGPTIQLPWGVAQTSAQPRPRPYDTPHPTSRNVVKTPLATNEIPTYNNPQSQLEFPEQWQNAPKPEASDGWGDISARQPSPGGQDADAAQAQQIAWSAPPRTSPVPLDHAVEQAAAAPRSSPTLPQSLPRDSAPQAASKKRGPAQTSVATIPKPPAVMPTSQPSVPKPPSPLPAPTPPKPAWSTPVLSIDDEKVTKQAGLREIQEAEAKRTETRKQAEREKERAARALPQEETQTFTASWGLPTSQAGAGRSVVKEQTPASATPPPAVTPVWTNAAKPPQAKRTMKEILEEEERRKKAAKERETAAAAARRAYADSANKVVPGPPAGGVWTTVGSGGKAASPAVRQVSGNSLPASLPQATARPTNGTSPARAPSATSQNVKSSASRSAPAEEGPVPPSPEFMKWLRDAVRGFNAGFNTEEFMAMLLAFPLDFPPSTVEVIQDMVYMNSATLDGRRFAAEFCSKRKADTANRPNGWGVAGKQPSLADVVKTQPKPAQNELPFKVVKKKGRGNALR